MTSLAWAANDTLLTLPLHPAQWAHGARPSPQQVHAFHHSFLLPHYQPVTLVLLLVAFAALFVTLHLVVALLHRSFASKHYRLLAATAKGYEFDSYIVSTMHAVIATVIGGAAVTHTIFNVYGLPLSQFLSLSLAAPSENSFILALQCTFGAVPSNDWAILVTCGYLLYDLCHTAYQASLSPSLSVSVSMLAHHAIIILAFLNGVYHRIGTFYMTVFLVNELSTPFLNINYFLSFLNLKTKFSQLYLVNAFLLLVTFTVFRVALNLLLLYHIFGFCWYQLQCLWRSSDGEWLVSEDVRLQCGVLSALAIGHVAINLTWWAQLILAVTRKFNHAKEVKTD